MNANGVQDTGEAGLAANTVYLDSNNNGLLDIGEKTFTLGFAGSLYAFCLGLGTLALLALAKFYWEEVEQIWTLLGDRYGNAVKLLIGLMSWSSLIGIEAVQIIAGAFILKVLGLSTISTMVGLAFLLMIISLLPVEKASLSGISVAEHFRLNLRTLGIARHSRLLALPHRLHSYFQF